jgi:hypothetical protein
MPSSIRRFEMISFVLEVEKIVGFATRAGSETRLLGSIRSQSSTMSLFDWDEHQNEFSLQRK